MTTIRGVYHGDRIEIRERLDFPLGSDVRLNVEREPRQAEGDIMDLFGVLDDQTFAEAVAKIVQDRDSLPTKPPVEFDAAS